MAEIANNLKRSSSNARLIEGMDLNLVPEEYFKSNFRLNATFFTIQSPAQASERTEDLNKHLEIIEANLGREITQNFGKFTLAFENFDEIKDDLAEVQK